MMLCLIPHFLDAIDMASGFNKLIRAIDTVMSELRDILSIIVE
jgi:hypothetical protein